MKTKSIAMTGTVVLSALLGISIPGYAAQEHQPEKQDHAKPQLSSHEQARPAQPQHAQAQQSPPQQEQGKSWQQYAQPQQARPEQAPNKSPQHAAQQPNRAQQEQKQQQARAPQQRPAQAKPQQHSQQARGDQHSQRTPAQQHFQQSAWQQHRASNWQSDHRTWQQRGGYNGYRIPDERFRGGFGQGHGFRVGGLPFLVVGGYPRFQYGGYWFSMVDPYPGNWAANWYDTDDVYVAYADNGYYLYNTRYPGRRDRDQRIDVAVESARPQDEAAPQTSCLSANEERGT